MTKMPNEDERLRKLKLAQLRELKRIQWQLDPLLWVEERLGESRTNFEWSLLYEGIDHKWDGDKDALAQAWRDLAQKHWAGIEAGTGTSKTYWLARVVMWFLDVYPGSLVITTAPKEAQLKLNLWSEISRIVNKFKKIHPLASLYKLRLVVDDTDAKDVDLEDAYEGDTWQAVGFVAGVDADEESAGRARGFHRENMLVILEECTAISYAVMTAFENTCTATNNLILACGNPDNEFDPLHLFCNQTQVRNYRISAFDHPNVVLDKELFPGAVTRQSIEHRKDIYGETSPLYNAMVKGISPAQSAESLIKLEWIDACVDRSKKVEGFSKYTGYNAVGVDVANSEAGDKAALAWGQGNILVKLHEFYCSNATHLAYNLFMYDDDLKFKNYSVYNTDKLHDMRIDDYCVGIDAVGVGVATVNCMVDNHFQVVALQGGQWEEAIPVEEVIEDNKIVERRMYGFNSLRSQMYWQAREDIRMGLVSIELTDHVILNQLKKELVIPKFDARGKVIAVESKENVKKRMGGKSPNVADAFVYWNWMRNGFRVNQQVALPISAGA